MISAHIILTEARVHELTGMSFDDIDSLEEFTWKVSEAGLLTPVDHGVVSLVEDGQVLRSFEVFWWDRHAAGCDDGWGVSELEVRT